MLYSKKQYTEREKNNILKILFFSLIVIFSLTNNSVMAINDPVVYYNFSDRTGDLNGDIINDLGSYGDTGVIHNNPTFENSRGFEWINFTENNAAIILDTNFNQNLTNEWSVAFWFRTTGETNSFEYLFGDMDFNFIRMQSDGLIRVRINGDFSAFYPDASTFWNDGEPHLIIAGYDGANLFYTVDDGFLINESDSFVSSTQTVTEIGRRVGNVDHFNGSIAQFRLYDRVLQGNERTLLFQELNTVIPTPINNTYSAFIEFETNTSNSFLDSFDVTPLNLTSGVLAKASAGLRGDGVSLSQVVDYRLFGLDNLTSANHTVSYWNRFQSFPPNVDTPLIGSCEIKSSGDYYCNDRLVLSWDDNSLYMFTHVYDADNSIEYIYSTKGVSATPTLRNVIFNSDSSSVMLNNTYLDLLGRSYGAFKLDELVVYPNTLNNDSISSLAFNGVNNPLFTQHPVLSPPGGVSYNTAFTNITINSTGVVYTISHNNASGSEPINYTTSIVQGVSSKTFPTVFNNTNDVLLKNDDFLLGGYHDIEILSSNVYGDSLSVFNNRIFICESVWSETLSSCVNDTQIKTYVDLNACVPSYDKPSDDGIVITCDDGLLSTEELDQRTILFKENLLYMIWIFVIGIALFIVYTMTKHPISAIFLTIYFYLVGIYLFIQFPSEWIIGVGALLIGTTFGLMSVYMNKN